MKNCLDEGTLQAWFDGELDVNAAADVAAHLHGCNHCGEAVRTIEAEGMILSRGLSAAFSEAIPTERLRQLVDAAVAGSQGPSIPVTNPSWKSSVRGLFPSFRVLAYGSMAAAVLFAGFLLVGYLKKNPTPSLTQANPGTVVQAPGQVSPEPTLQPIALKPLKTPAPRRKAIERKLAPEPDAMSLSWQERQYENAIAKLNEAIKSQPPMRPSLQVEYEYNVALIDNAIATTRDVAKQKPKDPQATQSMLAAYQSKVDLMNQIAAVSIPER